MRKSTMTILAAIAVTLGQPLAAGAAGEVARQAAPKDVASIAGNWIGKVTADIGQMEIAVSLTVKDGVASGSIETAHGAMTIAKGALKDGKWTLPFSAPDGGGGKMIAVLKGDMLSGDWDFSPNAVGTFELTRKK